MTTALQTATAAEVEIQGHRGARGLLPENTIAAFSKAIDLGVDVLELDVGVTRDGVVVVNHDRRLSPDMARDGDGNWIPEPGPLVKDLTAAELAVFDVGRVKPGSRTSRRFPHQEAVDGSRVPTLGQVLALAHGPGGGKIRFNIETKLSPMEPDDTVDPETLARAVVDEVVKAGLSRRVSVQSFDWRTLQAVQRLAPDIVTAYLTAEQRWLNNLQAGQTGASPWMAGVDIDDHGGSAPRAIKAMGGGIWSPYFKELSAERLAEAHALGLKVNVWTVNDPPDMARLAAMGVDGIITDYPDKAAEVLAKYRN